MNIGFIKLHRTLLESKVFANEKSLKIWIWLLLKVTFEKRFVPISVGRGTTPVELLPGELIFGRFQAEESLCIDGSTIYKKLKEFENDGMITIKSNTHYSIITICNWETYQGLKDNEVTANEQQSNNEVTTKGQQNNTNKKDKNIKKNKKIEIYDDVKSSYSKCIDIYNSFVVNQTTVKPIINGKQGISMKRLINYFYDNTKDKPATEQSIYNGLNYIFNNYQYWSEFQKGNLDLCFIHSKIVDIINSILENKKKSDKNKN